MQFTATINKSDNGWKFGVFSFSFFPTRVYYYYNYYKVFYYFVFIIIIIIIKIMEWNCISLIFFPNKLYSNKGKMANVIKSVY